MGHALANAARWPAIRWVLDRTGAGWRAPSWWDQFAEAQRGRFVLWLPVFMGAGVLAYFSLRAEPPPWLGAKCAAACFAAAIVAMRLPVVRACAVASGFAALGFASAQFATARAPPIETDLPAHAILAAGTAAAVETLPNGRRITLRNVVLHPDERPPDRAARDRAAKTKAAQDLAPRDVAPRDVASRDVISLDVAPRDLAPLDVAPLDVAPRDPAPTGLALRDPSRGDRAEPEPPGTLARTVRIRLRNDDLSPVQTGDIVRIRAMVRMPAAPVYPGAWDTQRDAYFTGLGASGYALGPAEIVSHVPPSRARAWIQWLRETIEARVTAAVPGAPGAVAATLLTGAARGIPDADRAAFRDSGLAHLLAVAGLHLGVVMGFVFVAARTGLALSEHASLFWPGKKIAACVALTAGGFYLLLTGAHVPIVRGFAMACLMTLAVLSGRQPVSLRALGLAAAVLMAIAPYEVPGVSFQMSFSAVLALIAGYEALRPWLRRLHGRSRGRRLLSHLLALALTSTLAGTASLPYGAYHFGHVQIYYVVSNMVAVPLTALWVMPAGLIALALMPAGLESLALVPMGWGTSALIAIARFTAALPGATVGVPAMPAWGIAVLSLGLAWLGIWRGTVRLGGLALIAAGVASPLFDRPPDIMISGDGGLIGFRTDRAVYAQQGRTAAAFARDAWLTRWHVSAMVPATLPALRDDPAFACEKDYCVFRPREGATAALWMRGPGKPADCVGIGAIVSAEPARGVCPWPRPALADRFVVWKEGPAAIWLDAAGAVILTDRAARGGRPWVPPPPKPKARPVSNLPVAPADQ